MPSTAACPNVQSVSSKPAVIPKTTGAQQAIFDPAPQFNRSTTRPIDAVVQIKTPQGLVPLALEQGASETHKYCGSPTHRLPTPGSAVGASSGE